METPQEYIVAIECDGGLFDGKTILVGPQDKKVRGVFSASQLDQINGFCKAHNFGIMRQFKRSDLI